MTKTKSSILPERCNKCGICEKFCPMGAISQGENGDFFVNQTCCIACRTCYANCEEGAVEMVEVEIPG